MSSEEYNPAIEFQTLREELLGGKKYVFERPLLIITVSFAILNLIDKAYIIFLPPISIGLLMFNLWFTTNRMHSIARIAAYIQIELEEKSYKPWIGWETCLRYYRKWIKLNTNKITEIINRNIDRDTIPDAIGYYPTIFSMHVIVVLIAFSGSVFIMFRDISFVTIILFSISTIVTLLFFIFSIRGWHPNKIKNTIENNRVIWIEVFKYLQKEGLKNH